MKSRHFTADDFMQRCFDLARLGAGRVSPNPMVGAVIVHEGCVIGEGFHQAYGQAHAEVNAVNSVASADRELIPHSTLYVSLEPCCIHGNTPPCTELIIRQGIPKVVVSALDQTPEVAGRGVQQLRAAGVEVETGRLAEAGARLSAIRNTFVTKGRPYVILKYAQTADGYLARSDGRPFWISNPVSKRLTHKWRSECDAILISGNTARLDNPQLTTRLYFGASPARIVLDRQLTLPRELSVFDGSVATLLAHGAEIRPSGKATGVEYLPVLSGRDLRPLLTALHRRKISTVMVEGGAQLLQSFIDQKCWDEARVFHSEYYLIQGLPAPRLPVAPAMTYTIDNDRLNLYYAGQP